MRFKAIVVGSATALFLAGGAVPALAAATWTAKIGMVSTGSGTFAATTTTTVQATNSANGVVITCTSATLSGTIPHLGSGLSGTGIGLVSASTWTSCSGGPAFSLTQVGSWSLNAVSYNATTGTTTGTVTGMALYVAASGCAFTLTGSETFTLINSTGKLTIDPPPGLGESGTSGCFGIGANGNVWDIHLQYTLTANSGGVSGHWTLTSP